MAIERDKIDLLTRQMRQLLRFVRADLSHHLLPANLETLRDGDANKKLQDNIADLETASNLLKELDNKDPYGTDPTSGNQRFTLMGKVSRVQTYFETELVPKIQELFQFLVRRGERGLAQQLQEILPEVTHNQPLLRSLANMETSYGEETIVQRQHGTPNLPQESGRSTLVTIARNQLEQLEEHQRRLNKFVHGYIKAHEHWLHWTEIQSELEEGRPASDKSWNKVKKDLQKQMETAEDIIKSLVSIQEVKEQIQELSLKLAEARGKVKTIVELPINASAETVQEAIDQVCAQMDGVVMKLEIIEEKCQEGAETELHEVDKLITAISAQVQETREAAERSRSAPAPMTIEFVRRSPAGEKTTERFTPPHKSEES